eukprot:4941178-Alexandrium_andersonii.AAC.1
MSTRATGGPETGAGRSAPSRTGAPGGGTATSTSGGPTSRPWSSRRSTLSARRGRQTAPSPWRRSTGTAPCSSA